MLYDVLAEYISARYRGRVVEIGIGWNFRVAELLAKSGLKVVATDMREIDVPEFIEFYVDDVMYPDLSIYEGANLIYSLRPPLELYPYIVRIAKAVGADCLIRPFGNEFSNEGRLVNYKGERFYVWLK